MNIKWDPHLKFESLKMKREGKKIENNNKKKKNAWASSQTCGLVPMFLFFG
jgi:hypothetical protein